MVDVVFELVSDREPGLLVLSGNGIGRAGLDVISEGWQRTMGS